MRSERRGWRAVLSAPLPYRMPTVHDLADALADALDRDRYHREGDPAGVWLASDRDVRRLGLRLEAGRAPYPWAEELDAALIHRPFGLWPARWPDGVGVLAVHRALDDRLAVGPNPALAAALGLAPDGKPLRRDGTAIGVVGRLPAQVAREALETRVAREFGGLEDTLGAGPEATGAVALVGAMTEALVEAAAERGAGLYVTGQIRGPARAAVERTGIRVLATGQDRAEAWGLRRIGRLLQDRWPALALVDSGLPAGSG